MQGVHGWIGPFDTVFAAYCCGIFVPDMNKLISQLQFGEEHSTAVVYHGIEQAFPNAVVSDRRDIYRQGDTYPFPEFALVSMKVAFAIDERIEFRTQLDEVCRLKLNCRTHKQCTIDKIYLPVKALSDEEDVGDVLLIKMEGNTAVCEGVLIRTPKQLGRYGMNRNPRGMCIIINNMCFEDERIKNREDAPHDENKLHNLFEDLAFNVNVHYDLPWDEMRKVAISCAKMDHSQYDAFVMIIMSHGDKQDTIMGVDGRSIRVEDLISEFKAEKCRTLRGKPKLFFFQTCRGSLTEHMFPSGECTDRSDCGISRMSTDSTLPRSTCPQEADFLLAFATTPGYVSWRNGESGSTFIQVLVKVIKDWRHNHHLLDMLTEVTRVVVEQGYLPGKEVQVPAPIHTLRLQLWLKDLGEDDEHRTELEQS